MDSILGVVQSPVFLGALLFLGMASLIRVLLSLDPRLKRAYSGERRRLNGDMPSLPFQDSNGERVTENRRTQVDRRRARLLVMQQDNLHG